MTLPVAIKILPHMERFPTGWTPVDRHPYPTDLRQANAYTTLYPMRKGFAVQSNRCNSSTGLPAASSPGISGIFKSPWCVITLQQAIPGPPPEPSHQIPTQAPTRPNRSASAIKHRQISISRSTAPSNLNVRLSWTFRCRQANITDDRCAAMTIAEMRLRMALWTLF